MLTPEHVSCKPWGGCLWASPLTAARPWYTMPIAGQPQADLHTGQDILDVKASPREHPEVWPVKDDSFGKGTQMKRAISIALGMLMLGLVHECRAELVARYPLDGSAKDSVSGRSGIEVGSPGYAPGVFNEAVVLDGVGSYINCGNARAFNLTGRMSVAAWVNIRSVPGLWRAIVAKGNSAWRLSTLQDQFRFHFAVTGGPGWYAANGNVKVQPGQWHHVCGTYDGSQIRLYVDGVLDATQAYTGGITTNSYDLCIGQNLEGGDPFWDGLIDDVCIYNHALSDDEVALLHRKGTTAIYEYPGLSVLAAPSGPTWLTGSSTFTDIADQGDPPVRTPRSSFGCGIMTERQGDLAITFNAEAWASDSARVIVRALVDGEPASPSDVILAVGGFAGTRTFTFAKENLGAGGHWVQMQWRVDAGGTAGIGDGTLTLRSSSPATADGRVFVKAAPSGPDVSTTGLGWAQVPDLACPISLDSQTNLAITVSGEAETSDGERMFVRALVDGQPASPSDVILCTGGWTGTRSFTFTRENVAPGGHAIQVEWSANGDSWVSMGDRTLTVVASPELTHNGGLSVKAAPSGGILSTTSSWWVDVPDMVQSIAAAANGKMEATFSGEVWTSGAERMGVRALVDGQPASPSDVVFSIGGFTGTRAFTFTREDLTPGSHEVRIQWWVDSGGTAFVGDHTLTVNHWRGQVPDLSKPFESLKPVIGRRNLLVILWDPHRPDHPAPTKAAVQDLIFGPGLSVRDYFLQNSGGRFTLENAGVLGWYDANKPADHYWNHPAACCPDGFIHGHVEKWTEAIRKADTGFDYRAYDINGDGVLSPDELGILIVIPQNDPFGTNREVAGRECPNWEPLYVDGVRINTIAEAYIGSPPSLGLVAHELSHLLLGAGDMYFFGGYPYAAGPYSLMDQSPNAPGHLDPFHKMRLGWLVPRIVGGVCEIPDVETHNEVCLLYDRTRGNKEYFLLENRWPGTSYDSGLPDRGLGLWLIIEDPAVYGSLAAPPGVDPQAWNDPAWTGWGRRAIRLVRPVYAYNPSMSLWDGSDPATGYDLLPADPNPNHVTLRWSDGTPVPCAIKDISPFGPQMEVLIDCD